MRFRRVKRTLAKILLGFIGTQILPIVAGICQKYIFSTPKPGEGRESINVFDCQGRDILSGAITSSCGLYEPIQDKGKVFSVTLIGTPSATTMNVSSVMSGDVGLDAAIDFPV